MTELLERLDSLTSAVITMAQIRGTRLNRAQLCEFVGCHRNAVQKMIADGRLPKPSEPGRWLLYRVLECKISHRKVRTVRRVAQPIDGIGHHLYRHFDKDGALLYIGISFSAVVRLAQHKEHAHWFDKIAKVEVLNYATKQDALEAERHAIETEKPLYNKTFNARRYVSH